MSKYILVAETGADVPVELAQQYNIRIVPMHVSFGDITKDDMTFPVEDIYAYYDSTGTLPKTSGSTPGDFEKVFDEIHSEFPDAHIIHLAYSAITTVSYQSAVIASEGRDYITSIDTKCVSVGQAMVVIKTAQYLLDYPNVSLEELKQKVAQLIKNCRMAFFPHDLTYLKAGGRVSNAQYLGAKILGLNPLIEIEDGKLISNQKYRGSMLHIAEKLIKEYPEKHQLDKQELTLLYSGILDATLKEKAEQIAKECGFKNIQWRTVGCVVAVHGGPGAFGLTGFTI